MRVVQPGTHLQYGPFQGKTRTLVVRPGIQHLQKRYYRCTFKVILWVKEEEEEEEQQQQQREEEQILSEACMA